MRTHSRRQHLNCIAAIAMLCAAASVPAQNPPPTCRAPLGVKTIASLAALPAPVRSALLDKAKDIVDTDQPFDATDVVMHGAHFNRFAFAWRSADRIVIATEHGGIAYSNPIYVYAWTGPTSTPKLLNEVFARQSKLCLDAEKALRPPATH